jgi:hypothetical protein
LATAPEIDPETGLSVIRNNVLDFARPPLAMTEWNLNGWFEGEAITARPDNQLLAYGIGAASYLNAILRVSDKVKIANQSMLVGTGWLITGIRVDTTEQKRPTMYPTALVTGLYSREHGNKRMEFKATNEIFYNQPLKLNDIKPSPKVAEQDVVITSDESFYYIHIVNRSFDSDRELIINFPAMIEKNYKHFVITDRSKSTFSETANVEENQLKSRSTTTTKLLVPSRSVSVFKFKRS